MDPLYSVFSCYTSFSTTKHCNLYLLYLVSSNDVQLRLIDLHDQDLYMLSHSFIISD